MPYIPKQITTFIDHPKVLYKTYKYIGAFEKEIEYLWSLENTDDKLTFEYLIIPDGCIDIISDLSTLNRFEIFVSKPFTKATKLTLNGRFKYWGIRCKPGMALKFLDLFTSDIKEDFKNIDFDEKELMQLKLNLNINEYSEALLQLLNIRPKLNKLTIILNSLDSNEYSERHYRRIHKLITGFNPKTFSKIIKANQNISNPKEYLAAYYDQSHFIKTFREQTGLTPKEFFKKFRI